MRLNDTWFPLPSAPFVSVFEGEPESGENAEVTDSGTPPPTEPKKNEKVKFDAAQQAYVNSLIAEERRKSQVKNDQLITQLETEKNRVGTTAAEKQALEDRIEGLKNEYATKETLKARETEKKLKELEDKNKQLEAQGATWEQRYHRDRKRIDLTQAAAEEKAYNPRQVVNELFSNSRLEPIVGDDGKPTDEYRTMVKINTVDGDGKPKVLDLDPVGAVRQLKEMREYQNLFISPATGGLGGGSLGRGGGGGGKAPHEMSTAEYMEYRKKQKGK